MEPWLLTFSDACREAGVTPIVVHHARKTLAAPYAPLELSDLAFAGVAELACAWLLLSWRERFEPGVGLHKLWLAVGESGVNLP
jgi:hypothetical protein